MTTERYLSRLGWLANMIQSRYDMLELERGRATNMVAPTDSDPVQTSPKDTLCEILSGVVDIDSELNGYIDEYKFILGQVKTLTGKYSPAYIIRRYAYDQSMREITSAFHVSRTTGYRIHDAALSEFEELYGLTYQNSPEIVEKK